MKKSLFIDLDETLVHSCHTKESPEIIIEVMEKFDEIKKVVIVLLVLYHLIFKR